MLVRARKSEPHFASWHFPDNTISFMVFTAYYMVASAFEMLIRMLCKEGGFSRFDMRAHMNAPMYNIMNDFGSFLSIFYFYACRLDNSPLYQTIL